LTGQHVEPLDGEGWYPAMMETLRSKDGTVVTVEVDRHPDALAEKIRSTVCEGEIIQIIGRGRGVNRTAANPLEVIVLGNVPIGPIDELQPWKSLGLNDSLVATGGVWLSSSKHRAEAYGCHARALESDGRRQPEVIRHSPILTSNTEMAGHLRQATYLRSGPGRKLAKVLFDQRIVPDIEAWLVKRLGPLAEIEIAGTEIAAPGVSIAAASEIVVKKMPAEAEVPAAAFPAAETAQAEYTAGIMPKDISIAIRDAYQDAGITQDRAAEMLGLSRPHLANALAGRFALSKAKVEKLHAFLAQPPPVVQPRLL